MDAIPVYCECGAPMGQMVQVNGRVRLDTGDWVIGEGVRHCHRCGQGFHFKPPAATWEELVGRYLKRNGNGNGNGHIYTTGVGSEPDVPERPYPNGRTAGAIRR